MTLCDQTHEAGHAVDLMVDQHVRAGRGKHLALIECDRDGARRSLTYESLMNLSMLAARYLDEELGGRFCGQRVALVGSATLENLVFWLGGMRSGRIVFMVDPGLPSHHYHSLWEDFRPDKVLHDCTAGWAEGQPMPSLDQLKLVSGKCRTSSFPPSGLHGCREGERGSATVEGNTPALVLATSGSTGKRKLCVHHHQAFYEFERNVTHRMWGLQREDRVLASGGPHFSFGLQGVHVPLSIGACAVLVPVRERHDDLLSVIEAEHVSVFFAVPTLYSILMAKAERCYDMSSLRLSLSAGERLPEALRQRWEVWSRSRMLNSIGTTETFSPYLSEVCGAGSGLRPVEGFTCHFRTVEPGEDGSNSTLFSIDLLGDVIMSGYLQDGNILPRGRSTRYATGDVFSRCGDVFSFVSREGDRMKISGQWVCPQDLEEFLMNDSRVLKALVQVVWTEDGLPRLRAYVTCMIQEVESDSGALLVRELMASIRSGLWPRALWPDRVELVEDLETTRSGKILRYSLSGEQSRVCAQGR